MYVENCTDAVLDQMPILKFQLDSIVYSTRPRQSLFQEEMEGEMYCTSTLVGEDEGFWILGGAFLNDFYQIYDMKRNQVGLVPSKYA